VGAIPAHVSAKIDPVTASTDGIEGSSMSIARKRVSAVIAT
jgi:hypothetical protein